MIKEINISITVAQNAENVSSKANLETWVDGLFAKIAATDLKTPNMMLYAEPATEAFQLKKLNSQTYLSIL